MTTLPPALNDFANSMVEHRRDSMTPADAAIFDLMVAIELVRRGLAPAEFHQELRIKAELHRTRSPYVYALMRSIASHIAPPNVVTLPTRPTPATPGAKP